MSRLLRNKKTYFQLYEMMRRQRTFFPVSRRRSVKTHLFFIITKY